MRAEAYAEDEARPVEKGRLATAAAHLARARGEGIPGIAADPA